MKLRNGKKYIQKKNKKSKLEMRGKKKDNCKKKMCERK